MAGGENTYLHNVGKYGILYKILLHGEQGKGSAPCGVPGQEKERKRIAELKVLMGGGIKLILCYVRRS